jgi:hypothetical protein
MHKIAYLTDDLCSSIGRSEGCDCCSDSYEPRIIPRAYLDFASLCLVQKLLGCW